MKARVVSNTSYQHLKAQVCLFDRDPFLTDDDSTTTHLSKLHEKESATQNVNSANNSLIMC